MPLQLSKLGRDVFAPTTASGHLRGADMGETVVWTTEIEALISALATGEGGVTVLDEVIYAVNTGAGTANAIKATATKAMAVTPYSQLITVNFVAENNGPMTLSINNETPKPMVLNVGSDIPAGYVKNGMAALVQLDNVGNYRMFTYGDASAIQAAAEAALAAAIAARDAAAAYAAGLNLPAVVVGDAGKALVVKSDGSGYQVQRMPSFADVWDTASPIAISLHFGTLAGTGFLATDPGGAVTSSTTSAVAASAVSIPVANGALFKVGQLICYRAINNQYYSNVVKSISTNTLNVARLIQGGGIASNEPISNFYADVTPHPNQLGYYTICDDALRQISVKSEQVYRSVDSREWNPWGATTLTSDVTPAYANPGSSDALMSGVTVAGNTNGHGAQSRNVEMEGGQYVTRVVFNPGTAASMAIQLGVTFKDGTVSAIGFWQANASAGAIEIAEFNYRVPPGAKVWIRANSLVDGAFSFWIGEITHRKVRQKFAVPNYGTHILFGDSWFAQGHFYNRLVSRLPQATIINKGVFGNKASDLLSRVAADVLALKPDFVWLMCGTNDYNDPVAAPLYAATMNRVLIQLVAAGIQVFLFDPSVGSIGNSALDPARKLTLGTNLLDGQGAGVVKRTALSIGPTTLAAGASAILGTLPGTMRRPARILFGRVSGVEAASLRFYYGSEVGDISGSPAVGLNGSTTALDQIVTKNDRNDNYLTVALYNTNAASRTLSGTVELEWYPSTTG
ncbi:SGNH/GDSL hydrolase family protein [Mesorhizobium retamae]|uniref:SGNH hydrolase-type esterase domain-containing protein n=1 Tax=Mesorhizobium retamae TaxID=2912854 RepID=A0ABS9QN33_9HYPH|nr:GDSL-type esterase/lipase family protein [Mesorhizobium sp. IRAMC:0171]MCG7508863.1 hypothetical protein [Mesorhizobium sp. IRAMC:0171]